MEVAEETDYPDLNLSPKFYQDVHAAEGIATLRLYGYLNFANAAKTQTAIEAALKELRAELRATESGAAEESAVPSRQQQGRRRRGRTAAAAAASKFFLVLDVSGLSGIDSSGCYALVNVRNRLRKSGVHLALVGPAGELLKEKHFTFTLSQLDRPYWTSIAVKKGESYRI